MRTRLLLIFIAIMIFNTSCFVTKYTHSQVMDMAVLDKSGDEILINFGTPAEKKTEGSYEEWIYNDLGERTINIRLPSASDSITNIRVKPLSWAAGGIPAIYENDHLKVTFQNGRTTGWTSSGIN